jgi:succinate-semialdehyde dehydrogenase/glutarate-semialdehyde dehydrogenase
VNGEFELYSASRINVEIKKAGTAFIEWKNLDVSGRAEYLNNAAKVLRKRKNELGKIITMEMGKAIKESVPEIEKCALAFEYFARNTGGFLEPEIVETDAKKAYVEFVPIGVLLGIMPWNFPFWQAGIRAQHSDNLQWACIHGFWSAGGYRCKYSPAGQESGGSGR